MDDSWAIVELMGHVRMAGRVSEEERFGAKLGRIDIPQPEVECKACGGSGRALPFDDADKRDCQECSGTKKISGGFVTQYFSGQSIYRMTPCTEAVARQVAKSAQPQPVSPYEFPKQLTRAAPSYQDEDDEEY